MSGAEAATAIGLISACIDITKTIISFAQAVKDDQGLPSRLRDLFEKLPIIADLLEDAQEKCEDESIAEEARESAVPILKQCQKALGELRDVLRKACPKDNDSSGKRIWNGVKTTFLGRESRVQKLLGTILENLRLLEQKQIYVIGDKLDGLQELTEALGHEDDGKYRHEGTGNIYVNERGTSTYYVQQGGGSNNRQINNPGTYNEGPIYYLPPKRPKTPPSPLSNVPFRRDPHFVERVHLTAQIDARLSQPAGRAALVGLGGVGKSQIAIEHAYRYRNADQNRWVLWLYASSSTRFEQSVRDVASLLEIRGLDDTNANIFQLFRAWLLDEQHGCWLVVLDNADDVDFLVQRSSSSRLIDCIPPCQHGAMIVTSRNMSAARLVVDEQDIVDVDRMDKASAVTLLARKLGKDANTPGFEKLVTALEFMPLAITQAAAFLQQSRQKYGIVQYLQNLETLDESGRSLLDNDHKDLRRNPDATNSIILTWQISFEYILGKSKSATDLLTLMSLCDRHSIPESLVGPEQREGASGSEIFEKDVRLLRDFSFIKESGTSTFEMHRLVQLATRRWSRFQGEFSAQVKAFVTKLDRAMPWVNNMSTPTGTCEILYPHARSAWHLEAQTSMSSREWQNVMDKASRLMNSLAWYYHLLGDSKRAAEVGEQCWAAMETQLGKEHSDTLVSMSNLARYYDSLGDSKRAGEMEEECWAVSKRQLGEEHPHTLISMSNLARYYNALGDSKRAAEMEEQCLAAKRRQLGEENSETLVSMSNLAGYCDSLGDIKRATEMGEQCWAALIRQLGEEHPHTLISMSKLAGYYDSLGDSKRAVEMEEQCWAALIRQLGEEHPDTLTSMSNLARYYDALGDSKRAAEMEEQCLAASRRQLGEEHPHTLISKHNLETYRKRGAHHAPVEVGERRYNSSERASGRPRWAWIAKLSRRSLNS